MPLPSITQLNPPPLPPPFKILEPPTGNLEILDGAAGHAAPWLHFCSFITQRHQFHSQQRGGNLGGGPGVLRGSGELAKGGDAVAEGAGRLRGRAIAGQAERLLAVAPLSTAVLLGALAMPRKVGGPYSHDLVGEIRKDLTK